MNILYSDIIIAFLKKIHRLAQTILITEVNLMTKGKRFVYKNACYPLHFVMFEHSFTLGYFKADFFEIGINKVFLFESEEELLNLLRHELAHYLTFIDYGSTCTSHGILFQTICKKYGWSNAVSRSTIKIEKIAQNEKLLCKVRKLLALGKSHHLHEAKAAIAKAQRLLVKYNLDLQESDDTIHLTRALSQKRISAKLQAIAAILRTFFVYPIFNHGTNFVYLELVGEKINVGIAEYVAHFLDQKFDMLWKQAQLKNPQLKGLASKNSFFRGVSQGYLHKTENHSSALIKVENHLVKSVNHIFPNLRTTQRTFQHHEVATQLGKKTGKNLTIHSGIANPNGVKHIN